MIIRLIITVLWFIHFMITVIIFFFIGLFLFLITYPFDKKRKILHLFTSFWGSYYTYTFPAWKIKIIGREKIDNKKTYVMVSNHQSLLDILVYFRLYRHFKWVSKEEVFKIPLIGWNMYFNQYVALRRGFRSSQIKMMKDCLAHLRKGNSVFIFPEGSRSEDGHIKPFQSGAFVLAQKAGVPLLPLAVFGSSNALPKKSLIFHGVHHIQVQVLDEINLETVLNRSDEELSHLVQSQILDAFEKMKKTVAKST